MNQIVEFEPRNAKANDGYRRFVAIEPNGTRHVLTKWQSSTRAGAKMAARGNGAEFVEVAPGTFA